MSKTIEKTAEAILGYDEDKIHVLGVAYKREAIEKDDYFKDRGLTIPYAIVIYKDGKKEVYNG